MQASGLQIFRHNLATRGQRGFHPRLAVQAKRARFAGHKTSADHHIGVRGVGARRDRGDHNRTVAQRVIFAFDGLGFARVMRLHWRGAFGGHLFGSLTGVDPAVVIHDIHEGGRCACQCHEILRALGAGDCGHDGAHIELQGRRVDRCVIRPAPEPVFLRIGFHQRDTVFVAAGLAQVAQGLVVDREEAAGRAIFRCHVGDGGALCDRQSVEAFAVEFDEFTNNAVFAQHLNHFEHEVGAGGAFHQLARELEAHDFRNQHRDRLAKHRGFCSMPPTPPAQNRKAVDHGGVAVGAHKRIRVGNLLAVLIGVGPNGLREVFHVHLVADTGSGGHNAEVVKGTLAPFQELVALHVALVFEIHVFLEGARVAEFVDHHRVVDHESTGTSG